MSIRSRREERRAGEILKAAGIDITTPDLIDSITHGGSITYNPDGTSFAQMYGATYGQMYKTQSAFRSVVDFLSRNVGSIHMKLSERMPDGSQRPRPEHPMMEVLEHPSPGVSYSRLMRQVVADKAIYDVAALWKIRENFFPTPNKQGFVTNSGKVVALVRLPIPFLRIAKLSLTAPMMFELNTGEPIKIRPEDIIWMPGYAPDSNILGVPPTETLRQILAEEWAAGKNQENQWKKGPHGNTVFIQDINTPGLDPNAAENFKTSWRKRYGGVTGTNAGEVPLMPVGITPKQIAFDAQDQQYLQTRNLAREEVCREFGFNPALLGITPSNFASADSFHQMLYQDTLTPWCVSIQEDFEEQLLTEFEGRNSNFALDFNINAKLAGSFLEQAKIGQQAVGGPWMTTNEFREKFQGLPPVPGGNEIIVPLNVVRGGGTQANPQDAPNQFTKAGLQLLAGEE